MDRPTCCSWTSKGIRIEKYCAAGLTPSRVHRPDCFIEMHVGCGLEKFGGSVAAIADSLHELGYGLWMSSPALDAFVPFSGESAMVTERFFLIATVAAS